MPEFTPEDIAAIQEIIESAKSFSNESILGEGALPALAKIKYYPLIRDLQQKEIGELGGYISRDQLDAAGNANFVAEQHGPRDRTITENWLGRLQELFR